MLLNVNEKRALKGLLISRLSDYKKMFIVVMSVLIGVIFITFIATLVQLRYSSSFSITTTGVLSTGFITTIITFSIAAFVSSSKAEIGLSFTFPISRKLYAIANFIVIIAGTFIFLAAISVLGIFELLIFKVLSGLFDNLILVNGININNYFAGFWVSLCYIALMTSISHIIGVCFFKNKIATAIIFGIMFCLVAVLPEFGSLFMKAVNFYVYENSIVIFSIKACLSALALQLLAYIPLKNMEVKV